MNEEKLDVTDIKIEDSVKGSYLDYSMSVIIGRALPDARDGLKPVHRRILYAMHDLHMGAKTPYKKSARIVGDVIGKYHPHGDSSVYDALVRMAQDFAMRVPLVDGQGNFGSVDGDNAAAMRYTEARMTPLSEDLLIDLDSDTVNHTPTYDGAGKEPVVLPNRLPTLLINGSEGIAVGMATKIPPHNPTEILNATIKLLDNPNVDIGELISCVQGPDFPTGGIVFGTQGYIDAYRTGRGKVKVRAKHHIETIRKKEVIVIDELPYQVNKARLVENIANLVRDKVIDGIGEIRDESDREGTRIVIETKKDAMIEIIMNNLYKATQLQLTYGMILLAVHNKEPKIFNLKELLSIFINHRKTIVIRRTIFNLNKAEAREHILLGLKVALDNVDAFIKVIRNSDNDVTANNQLCDRFKISKIQAKAILDMRFSRLTNMSIKKLKDELKELSKYIKGLKLLLKSEKALSGLIRNELLETMTKYDTKRRTTVIESYDDIDVEDLIPNEPMVVTITHNGYVKRVPAKTYDMQIRGGKGKLALTTHEDDFIEQFFVSNTHDTLLLVTNFGQLYWLKVYKIPEGGRVAKGKAIVNLVNLKDKEKIMTIIPTTDFDDSKAMTFFTKKGVIKRTSLADFSNIRSNGVRAIVLDADDELVTADITTKASKYIMIFTAKGQVIRFLKDKVRVQGRSTKGVLGIKFKVDGDYVVDGDIISGSKLETLTVSENGVGKRTAVSDYRLTNRGGSGVISMKLSKKTGPSVIGNVIVDPGQDLMVLTSIGKMIRLDMGSVKRAGRNTSGVNIVDVDKGDAVVSIAKCTKASTISGE